MPWKLIVFLAAAALVLIFIAFNVGSWASVSFVFFRTPETPVFLIILVSFLLGMLSLLPMVIIYRPRKRKEDKAKEGSGGTAGGAAESESSASGSGPAQEDGAEAGGEGKAPRPDRRGADESRRGKKERS